MKPKLKTGFLSVGKKQIIVYPLPDPKVANPGAEFILSGLTEIRIKNISKKSNPPKKFFQVCKTEGTLLNRGTSTKVLYFL